MGEILCKNWNILKGKKLVIGLDIQEEHCTIEKYTNSNSLYCKRLKRIYKNDFSLEKIIKTITLYDYCKKRHC